MQFLQTSYFSNLAFWMWKGGNVNFLIRDKDRPQILVIYTEKVEEKEKMGEEVKEEYYLFYHTLSKRNHIQSKLYRVVLNYP